VLTFGFSVGLAPSENMSNFFLIHLSAVAANLDFSRLQQMLDVL